MLTGGNILFRPWDTGLDFGLQQTGDSRWHLYTTQHGAAAASCQIRPAFPGNP